MFCTHVLFSVRSVTPTRHISEAFFSRELPAVSTAAARGCYLVWVTLPCLGHSVFAAADTLCTGCLLFGLLSTSKHGLPSPRTGTSCTRVS